MSKKFLVLGLSFLLVSAFSVPVAVVANPFETTTSYEIKAAIPNQVGLTVDVYRDTVGASNRTLLSDSAALDFGDLTWDSENELFTSNYYYLLDISILSNVSNWSIAHQATPVSLNGQSGGPNLDENIEVAFSWGSTLDFVAYSDSNNRTFSNVSWMQIVYTIPPNSGGPAQPITMENPAGQYSGTVTLTLYDDSV